MNSQNTAFEFIIFGGGCFWCVEAVVQRLKGVINVQSGYAGGTILNPTYEQVSSGESGYIEVVKVEFDPAIISLENLLAVFFSSHDPTSLNKQGNDAGEQYKSVIFYTSAEQKSDIASFIAKLAERKVYAKPIVTEVRHAGKFYEAEGYHQNYYNNNKTQAYCQLVIDPKIKKLREQYLHLLKE